MFARSSPSLSVHPSSVLSPHVQPSERKVHKELATALPPGWSAWHSLKIRIRARDFSEADFVIADPAHRFVRVLLGKYKERELVPPVIGVGGVPPRALVRELAA